jgi:ABC-2 type transport system permease protein
VVLLFIRPLLTMRLFAEEKKQGTIELLLTYPVRDLAAVLAKFSACLAVYTIMLALTAVYPVLLIIFAQPEVGPISPAIWAYSCSGLPSSPWGASLVAHRESDRRRRHQLRVFAVLLGHRLVVAIAGSGIGWLLSHLSLLEHFDSFPKGTSIPKM